MRIAYIMSRFPKLTETFILYEMIAMEETGETIEVYPLIRENEPVIQAEAHEYVERAHFTPFLSLKMIWSNIKLLFKKPGTYVKTLTTIIHSNWGSRRFLLGKLVYFPKSVYLAEMMTRDKIDHIHVHFASFPAAVAYMIHQFSNISYSFTAHGSDLHRDQHMLCEKIQDAKYVISISQYNKDMMIDHCGKENAEKIKIVHCGVDLERFKQDEAVNQTNSSDYLSIICIGSLHEVKGQRYLIEACHILHQSNIPFHCNFVGDGEDRKLLEEMVESYGIDDKVTFHGRLAQADVIRQLKQADVAALTSVPSQDGRREGIPVALMEAMAFSLPVVATRLSGIPELVDDGITGYLTEAGDSEAIATALTELSQNPDQQKIMGRAGRAKIEAEFELRQNAKDLSHILRA